MINKAIEFARVCHSKQVRKSSNIPYILHPLEAGVIASSLTIVEYGEIREDLVAAAILHDVCEDAKVGLETLDLLFNSRITELVNLQSEDKSKTWKERKGYTLDQLRANEDKGLEILILADKLSNLRSIKRDYDAIGDRLWERFNERDKSQQAWYYKGIGEYIRQLGNTVEYKEYMELLDQVFH